MAAFLYDVLCPFYQKDISSGLLRLLDKLNTVITPEDSNYVAAGTETAGVLMNREI